MFNCSCKKSTIYILFIWRNLFQVKSNPYRIEICYFSCCSSMYFNFLRLMRFEKCDSSSKTRSKYSIRGVSNDMLYVLKSINKLRAWFWAMYRFQILASNSILHIKRCFLLFFTSSLNINLWKIPEPLPSVFMDDVSTK